MAVQPTAQLAPADSTGSAESDAPVPAGRHGPGLWQMPVIVLSVLLIGGGLWFARRPAPHHDIALALTAAEEHLAGGHIDEAAEAIEREIEPWLESCSEIEKARYHAIAADVTLLSIDPTKPANSAILNAASEHAAAAELGGHLPSPQQLERWAMTDLQLGHVDEALRRCMILDGLAHDPDLADEAAPARARVMRGVVMASLDSPHAEPAETLELLAVYRAEATTAFADQAWAAARQAEIRLRHESAREAIDNLMIDIRRFEPHLEPGADLGELLSILARGYGELGELDFAQDQSDLALQMVPAGDPRRAAVLVNSGWILAMQSRFEEALQAFTTAADLSAATPAHADSLLGRAEMHGVLGDHEASQNDYRTLAELFRNGAAGHDLSAERAVLALAERRHDAALASGQLDLALEYLEIAPSFLPFEALPEQVLWRFGGTHRALAERLIADSHDQNPASATDPLEIDPGVRTEVSRHYREAGDAFVARAEALVDSLSDENEWANSIWLAADSYDSGGYHELAIARFAQYVANRPDTDPRRVEAAFRLAQCHHAAGQTEAAAAIFESVIAQNPDSPFATASHLPLADCYAIMGLSAQAEQQLLEVVSGHEHVGPDAVDYRNALFALGTLYYNEGDFRRAVEELTRAIERYPNDPIITSLRFRLADSYRSLAREIDDAMAAGEIARPEIDSRRALRENHLREAMNLFAHVEDAYARIPAEQLDTLQRDERRLAAMYVADGAYDLGEYLTAIDLYDRAASEWSDDASSLIALVQIVNCHTALGDHAAAGAAHHRALLRLSQLPASAFEGDDALFDETAWKQWLEGLPPGSAALRNRERVVSDASSSH